MQFNNKNAGSITTHFMSKTIEVSEWIPIEQVYWILIRVYLL
ncbi:hypothetical protein [Aureibaculum flavum]|nr:hypothetical protein [Aureibaculum flavum]